jgi:hypothetical protein
MPMPKPGQGETESEFVSRCIKFLNNEGSALADDQKAAACYNAFQKGEKLETIEEITAPGFLVNELGTSAAHPESVLPGQYPEFEAVELPETLKPRPFGGAGRDDFE